MDVQEAKFSWAYWTGKRNPVIMLHLFRKGCKRNSVWENVAVELRPAEQRLAWERVETSVLHAKLPWDKVLKVAVRCGTRVSSPMCRYCTFLHCYLLFPSAERKELLLSTQIILSRSVFALWCNCNFCLLFQCCAFSCLWYVPIKVKEKWRWEEEGGWGVVVLYVSILRSSSNLLSQDDGGKGSHMTEGSL